MKPEPAEIIQSGNPFKCNVIPCGLWLSETGWLEELVANNIQHGSINRGLNSFIKSRAAPGLVSLHAWDRSAGHTSA
ncbi:MAG: hypothetical protein PS018_11325 [bacterium]|nr:hypothetical protein [bacterium]